MEMSIEHHITEDERKLDRNDLLTVRRWFHGALFKPYRLFACADRVLPLGPAWEKLDLVLLTRLKLLRPLAGFIVIEATNNG